VVQWRNGLPFRLGIVSAEDEEKFSGIFSVTCQCGMKFAVLRIRSAAHRYPYGQHAVRSSIKAFLNAILSVSWKGVYARMKKCMVLLLVGMSLFWGATGAGQAAILFDYEVLVDGNPPFIPVDFPQSSGANGILRVEGVAGVNFDASGIGTDIDAAVIFQAFQTPPSASFSFFDGSTSSYTFTIRVIDLASGGMTGDFTVKGFLHGQFRTNPQQFAIGNTYTLPPSGQSLVIGTNRYFLNFPVFGQDFDPPGSTGIFSGSWTFNIRAVPEPGSMAMLIGAAVCGTLFLPRRLRRSRR
jgi:hypothetical protein